MGQLQTIRLAERRDAEAIDKLLRDFSGFLDAPSAYRASPELWLQTNFEKAESFVVLLAFEGETAIGLSIFFPEFSSWRCSMGVYVQDLYVDSDFRGGGVGWRLLLATLQYSRK